MAEETFFNGVSSEGDFPTTKIVQKEDVPVIDDPEYSMLIKKLHELEVAKSGLEKENSLFKSTISSLSIDVQELSNEKSNLEASLGEMKIRIEEYRLEEKTASALAGKIGELESKVDKLENKLKDRCRTLEETLALTGKKDSEILELKKRSVELEMELEKQSLELDKTLQEKMTEMSEKNMASETVRKLGEEVEQSKKVIIALKEKAVNAVNEVATAAKGEIFESEENESTGLMVQWRDVGVATGLIASVAVIVYLVFAKRGQS